MTGIVVGVDGSDSAAIALHWALHEADMHGWPVTAVMAWGLLDQHHPPSGTGAFDPGYGESDALAALDAYVIDAVGPVSATTVARRVTCDLAAPALLSASTDASLLVVGARGLGGFKGMLLGSVSEHCLHHADCALAIIGHDGATTGRNTMERIVVGIDGSETAQRSLCWAVEEARLHHAALEVVHAWQLPIGAAFPYSPAAFDPTDFEDAARKTVDAALERIDKTRLARPIERIVTPGGPATAILEAAKGADLVVVGSRGLGGFKGLLLGSVSHQVAHHVTCPVVIIPPES